MICSSLYFFDELPRLIIKPVLLGRFQGDLTVFRRNNLGLGKVGALIRPCFGGSRGEIGIRDRGKRESQRIKGSKRSSCARIRLEVLSLQIVPVCGIGRRLINP